MAGLFQAHSGLRFLVLIVGVVEVGALALALVQKTRPSSRRRPCP
jgi:hypothetical protein